MYGLEFIELKNGVYRFRKYNKFALLQQVRPYLVVRRAQVEYILNCIEHGVKPSREIVNSYNAGINYRPVPPITVSLNKEEFLIWLAGFLKFKAVIKDSYIEICHMSRELLQLIKDTLELKKIKIHKKSARTYYLHIKRKESMEKIKDFINSYWSSIYSKV
jgi:LAGLIDADG endonuclease.